MKVANRNLTPAEWPRFISDPADLNRPYHATCDNLPGPNDATRGTSVAGDAMAPAGATPVASGEAA